jgi:hypothetical protein
MAAMRFVAAILFALIALCVSGDARASQVDAREVARINNCPPKKIDIYQQALGYDGRTVYQVQCNMPKVVGTAPAGPDTLLIACDGSLCSVMQPTTAGGDKK